MSLGGLVLLIWGYGMARSNPVILYTTPPWLHYVNFLLMLSVFPLFIATYIPGKIKSTVKHPTFTAIKIWAFAHLLVNGSHADVLLFGCFLAWAVAGRISMKHRKQRPAMGLPAAPYKRHHSRPDRLGHIYAVFRCYPPLDDWSPVNLLNG